MFVLFGLIAWSPAGPIVALPVPHLTPENRGIGMGVFFSYYYLGIGLFPTLAGWIRDLQGDAALPATSLLGAAWPLVRELRGDTNERPFRLARHEEPTGPRHVFGARHHVSYAVPDPIPRSSRAPSTSSCSSATARRRQSVASPPRRPWAASASCPTGVHRSPMRSPRRTHTTPPYTLHTTHTPHTVH